MAFELQRMLARYVDSAPAPGHLASKFKVGPLGIHSAAEVLWDVQRSNRKIAYPQANAGVGYHMNDRSGFSAKKTAPPVYMEGNALAASDLLGVRQFGQNPFADQNFMAAVNDIMSMNAAKITTMIQGSLELMASQILTTGAISLVNTANAVVFSEDFKMKETHRPVASVAWSTPATAKPVTEIANLCDVINRDGKSEPKTIEMNSSTFEEMIATTEFSDAASNQKYVFNGEVVMPENRPNLRGAKYRGRFRFRQWVLEMYTYDEEFEHPYQGTVTKYIPDGKYIIEAGERYDATFGGILKFGEDTQAMNYLGGARLNSADLLQDLDFNAWISLDRTVINLGIGTRPLLIPVAIDTYGCGSADTA